MKVGYELIAKKAHTAELLFDCSGWGVVDVRGYRDGKYRLVFDGLTLESIQEIADRLVPEGQLHSGTYARRTSKAPF